jgi:hypothetical protein
MAAGAGVGGAAVAVGAGADTVAVAGTVAAAVVDDTKRETKYTTGKGKSF